jgi:DMSO/TMAO reductase YedYZ molybdopterin-dependent catalytic subunit
MKDTNLFHPITEQPYNAETPIHALSSKLTPVDLFYVRNHFDVPKVNAVHYEIIVNGTVAFPLKYSLLQLKEFPEKNLTMVMECAGNGRSSMKPKINGTPWDLGAISQAEFTGTSLRNILKEVKLADDVREI